MARKAGVGVINRRNPVSTPVMSTPVQERRLPTPRPDLFVVKIGDRYRKFSASPKEQTAGILARLAKAIATPGADRTRLFQSSSGKPVYAYFIHAEDPTKIVREDASGRQTIGRLVGGRFRASSSAQRFSSIANTPKPPDSREDKCPKG
jgi:hypothetical protein